MEKAIQRMATAMFRMEKATLPTGKAIPATGKATAPAKEDETFRLENFQSYHLRVMVMVWIAMVLEAYRWVPEIVQVTVVRLRWAIEMAPELQRGRSLVAPE